MSPLQVTVNSQKIEFALTLLDYGKKAKEPTHDLKYSTHRFGWLTGIVRPTKLSANAQHMK